MKISSKTSGVSLHFEKHKACDADINGLKRHNERKPGAKHSNKKIKDERTKDNIILVSTGRSMYKRVEKLIIQNCDDVAKTDDGRLKGVRKDAVRMIEATVQLSGQILDRDEAEQEAVLRDAYDWLKQTYGADNIVSAAIHKDETHMHLHCDFVPVETGKLNAKKLLSKDRLRQYQTDFLTHLQSRYKTLNFVRGSSEYNGLPQKVYEALQAEREQMIKEVEDMRQEVMQELEEKQAKLQADAQKIKQADTIVKQRAADVTKREAELTKEKEELTKEKEELTKRETAVTALITDLRSERAEIDEQNKKSLKTQNTASQMMRQANERIQKANERERKAMQAEEQAKKAKRNADSGTETYELTAEHFRNLLDRGVTITESNIRQVRAWVKEAKETTKPTPEQAMKLTRDYEALQQKPTSDALDFGDAIDGLSLLTDSDDLSL